MIDYDKLIKDFIEEWESVPENVEDYYFRRSLSHLIAQQIYANIRAIKFSQTVFHKNKRFKNLKNLSAYAIWYLLWTVKWFLRNPIKNDSNYIITSFLPDKENSFTYLKHLSDFASTKRVVILNFSISCNFQLFLKANIFCFPHFFLAINYVAKYNQQIETYKNVLSKLIRKFFGEEFYIEFNSLPIKKYLIVRQSFEHLINKTLSLGKVKFFLQDIDYLGDKILFYEVCKRNNITVVSVEHSIKVYSHLFSHHYSDLNLVWGEFSKNQIIKCKENALAKIKITGRPISKKYEAIQRREKKYWLYVLTAFHSPLIQSIHRSPERSYKIIKLINNSLKKHPGKKLLIRKHPDDKDVFNEKELINYTISGVQKIISSVELIFAEDSTLTLELLSTGIPIIFIPDLIKSDSFWFKSLSSIFSLEDDLELNEVIERALYEKVDTNEREKMYEYYFGKSENFSHSFLSSLDNL